MNNITLQTTESHQCNHDVTFRRQNEAAGGYGCPKCRTAVAIVEAIEDHAKREGYYRSQAVILPEAQAVAERRVADYREYERGLGCAGNEPETCEAGGWG